MFVWYCKGVETGGEVGEVARCERAQQAGGCGAGSKVGRARLCQAIHALPANCRCGQQHDGLDAHEPA